MRRFWLVCLLILGFAQLNAQDILQYIDSLENVAKNQEGEAKILTLLDISDSLMVLSFDDGVAKIEQAGREALKIRDSLLYAEANLELAEKYIKRFDLDLAESYLQIALENVDMESEDALFLKYDICTYLAYINLRSGLVDTAIFYYEKSFGVAQLLDEKGLCADVVNNIAILNRNRGNQIEAYKGFERAVGLYYEVNDSLYAARALNNIAMLYYARQQYDEALSIFKDLIPFFEREGEYKDLSMTYSNLGLISSDYKEDIDSAMILLDKARYYANLANDSLKMVDITLNEGDLFMKTGDFEKAFDNFEKAKQLATRLLYNEGLAATYYHLAEGDYLLGNYYDAIDNIKMCMTIEERNGVRLYTPMFKSHLAVCYAHVGMYDSLEEYLNRRESDYNDLLNEKNQMHSDSEEVESLRVDNAELKDRVNRLKYAVAGLSTLLVVLAIYTIVSGRSRKEK